MTTTHRPPPSSAPGEALRFGWSYLAVETRQVLSSRWRRRTTALWAALVVEGAIIGAGIGWLAHHLVAGLALGTLVGLITGPVATLAGEAWGYHRAIWRQFHHGPGHTAGAYARDHTRHWEVLAVHAHPTGTGQGRRLMDDLIAHADDHDRTLTLKASCPDAVRFYRRCGFTVTGHTALAATPMTRPPATTTTQMSDPPPTVTM